MGWIILVVLLVQPNKDISNKHLIQTIDTLKTYPKAELPDPNQMAIDKARLETLEISRNLSCAGQDEHEARCASTTQSYERFVQTHRLTRVK